MFHSKLLSRLQTLQEKFSWPSLQQTVCHRIDYIWWDMKLLSTVFIVFGSPKGTVSPHALALSLDEVLRDERTLGKSSSRFHQFDYFYLLKISKSVEIQSKYLNLYLFSCLMKWEMTFLLVTADYFLRCFLLLYYEMILYALWLTASLISMIFRWGTWLTWTNGAISQIYLVQIPRERPSWR